MPVDETLRLLLVRPRDFAVLSIRCIGFDVQDGALVASPGAAFVELTLPPQAIGEMVFDVFDGVPARARVSHTCWVTLAVPSGARLPLTADGFLDALAAMARATFDAPFGEDPAVVELPWGLLWAAQPVASADALVVDLPGAAVEGPSAATGLWHLRIEAASGLAMRPVRVFGDDGLTPPLNHDLRERIYSEGLPIPPTAPFVDLSALGGTLSAAGRWPTFFWQQETVLGRDMAVRTEAKGFLYPFGHRAVLVQDAQRVMDPPIGPATAGIQQRLTLVVTEPLRGRPEDGATARGFPFDEVEIIERTFDLGVTNDLDVGRFPRAAKQSDELERELAVDRQALTDAEAAIPALIAQRHLDNVAAAEVAFADAQRGGLTDDQRNLLAELEALWADFQAGGEFMGQSDYDAMVFLQRMRDDPANVAAVNQAYAFLQATYVEAQTEDLVADTQEVYDARWLRARIDEILSRMAAIQDAVKSAIAVFEWQRAPSGQRLQVPMRCDGVRFALPLLFVHDIDLPETEDLEQFAPALDNDIQRQIANAWATSEGRHVALPSLPLDLVRADVRQPGDVHPVHVLSILGTQYGDTFRPSLEQVVVELPAVRALVPEHDGLTRLTFDPDYLASGLVDEVALRLPDGLGVDFRAAADRSGGLISPVFQADALSRVAGPVDLRTLPGLPNPPDLGSVFADATLLGLPLGSVLDAVPEQLTIMPEPGGGARMTWKDMKLKSHGPLRVRPDTTLEMSVVQSPAETVTHCRVERFSLVLPPGAGDLVELSFEALAFTQRPGRPPDLAVDGLRVKLGGDLGLLQTLQDAVDLGDAAPQIHSTPTGMSASYTLAVPNVQAGVFLMRDIAVGVSIDVPFDGRPVVASLSFGSREHPFRVSVPPFGGSGYLAFKIAEEGIRQLEASLDFGATVSIGVGVATAEVHALGGVRFALEGDTVRLSGFLRIGGSVDVLGLVSVSVELRVELTYGGGVLSGRAIAVIEVDVTFWSGSIELDSGTYTFAGAQAPGPAPAVALHAPPPAMPDWQRYRDAFAPEHA